MSLPARRAVSCHVFSFFFSRLVPMRLRLANSGRIGQNCWNGLFRPKFKKKKKKKKRCKTHRLNLITNPTSAHFIQTPNFSSLSLRHSSLTLSVLFASLSLLSISSVAVRHSATQSLHSNFSSLTHSQLSYWYKAFDLSLICNLWFVICESVICES